MHSSYTHIHRHTDMITQTQRSSPDSSLVTPTKREGLHGCTGSSSQTGPEVGLFPQSAPLSLAPGMNIFQRGLYYLDRRLRSLKVECIMEFSTKQNQEIILNLNYLPHCFYMLFSLNNCVRFVN